MTPRTGDHVRHHPSGQTWVVAFVEGDHVWPAGWPEGAERMSECTVVHRCTDEEHDYHVDLWRQSTPSHRRTKVLEHYTGPIEEG